MSRVKEYFGRITNLIFLCLLFMALVGILDFFVGDRSANSNLDYLSNTYPPPDTQATDVSAPAKEQPYPSPVDGIVATEPSASGVPQCGPIIVTTSSSEKASPLESYKLSEPKVVLESDTSISIAEWLDNNNEILISHAIPGSQRETIELFSISNGSLQSIGERNYNSSMPIWFKEEQGIGVAYSEYISDQRYKIMVYDRNGGWEQKLSFIASRPYIAAHPNVGEFTFYSGDQSQQIRTIEMTGQEIVFVVNDDSSDQTSNNYYQPKQLSWNPTGTYLAIYDHQGLFLVDSTTGKLCNIDLGFKGEIGQLWPYDAKWSPDGRFLAILVTNGERPLSFIDLAIVDVTSGKINHIASEYNSERHYFTEIAWGANSRVLATYAFVGKYQSANVYGLIFYDVATGQSKRMLPEVNFHSGDFGVNLAWSPNGKFIALSCWNGPLCMVEVNP
ncbi:MAG: hypothetical protein JXB15_11800 [Anaerolineales bacterium]|nr:hypothetical protein [Anaerolineales bacterium]